MDKDWIGGYNSVFKTLGANNQSDSIREVNDYYATDPIAIDRLASKFDIPMVVCEPCCGAGHLAKRLEERGHCVYPSDIADRGYGVMQDFFAMKKLPQGCNCILTNPPYKWAMECVLHSLDLLKGGGYCIMFLKTSFLEGKKRHRQLFNRFPPYIVYQFSERVICAKNGDFAGVKNGGGSAVAYAWFVWKKGYQGKTTIDWI